MIRTHRLAVMAGSLATTAGLLLTSPGLAQAATYQRGNAESEHTARDTDGDADARAHATRAGALSVGGEANGGGDDVLILDSPNTVARSTASLKRRVPAAEGTYRLVIRYAGARGTDYDRRNGKSDIHLLSSARFNGAGSGNGPRVHRTSDLTGDRRSEVVRFVYSVPNNRSGHFILNAKLAGNAKARSQRDVGRYTGSVRNVRFDVTRISG